MSIERSIIAMRASVPCRATGPVRWPSRTETRPRGCSEWPNRASSAATIMGIGLRLDGLHHIPCFC
jgi:hypothetical protein